MIDWLIYSKIIAKYINFTQYAIGKYNTEDSSGSNFIQLLIMKTIVILIKGIS